MSRISKATGSRTIPWSRLDVPRRTLHGDGLGFAVAFESLGTADDHGFALRFLEYVRLGERAFKTDGGNMGKKLLLELVDSGSQHGGVLCG